MKKTIFAGSIIVFALIIIVSFFMPWAKTTVSATKVAKGLADSVGGKLQDTSFAGKFVKEFDKVTKAIENIGDVEMNTTVSGYDIPTMMNNRSSYAALQLVQIMYKNAEDLDRKSMFVYLLPLLAAVCIGLAIIGLRYKISVAAGAIIGGVIGVGGLYKLISTDLSGLPVRISIENGLWQTMYGFLIICILSVAWLIVESKK